MKQTDLSLCKSDLQIHEAFCTFPVLGKVSSHVKNNKNRCRPLNLNKNEFNSKWTKDFYVRFAATKLLEGDGEHVEV